MCFVDAKRGSHDFVTIRSPLDRPLRVPTSVRPRGPFVSTEQRCDPFNQDPDSCRTRTPEFRRWTRDESDMNKSPGDSKRTVCGPVVAVRLRDRTAFLAADQRQPKNRSYRVNEQNVHDVLSGVVFRRVRSIDLVYI